MKVVVLGAGIGGLSVACRLSSLGHDVILIEKNNYTGGKAGVVKFNGYTFSINVCMREGSRCMRCMRDMKERGHW